MSQHSNKLKILLEFALKEHYEKASDYFDIDEMIASVYDINVSDDTIVTIEFGRPTHYTKRKISNTWK